MNRFSTPGVRHSMLSSMRIAFKEWAIVEDALGRGEQIVILRKGGILEGRHGFQVEHPRFLLFPTLFHQQRESVLPAAQARYDAIAPSLPNAETLRLRFWAEVVAWRHLADLAAAQRLQGQHIWREEVVAERFAWGKAQGIYAMAVRVYQLPAPIELPMQKQYGGCKSWIELDREIDTADSRPVLSSDTFQEKAARFESALELTSQHGSSI